MYDILQLNDMLVPELKDIAEAAKTGFHPLVSQFALDLVPGAASEENLTVGIDNRRVAAKQSGVWMIAKDIHRRLDVIW